MLFYQTMQRIKKIEYFHIKKDSDYFQFKHIEKINQNYFDLFSDYLKFKFYEKKLIGVKLFVFERNKKIKNYKAKYYHDLRKEYFYCKVSPYNYFDKLLMIYYNFFNNSKFE